MKIVKNTLVLALAVLFCCVGMSDEVKTKKLHATTLGYAPKYGPGFEHFEYVNPSAPKGGTMRFAVIGGYDTFNPYTAKGDFAAGLAANGNLYESLMMTAEDDFQAQYGLIAESLEVAEDLSFAIFHLRPEARFSDGTPITAEDVKFSFHTLVDHGHPRYAHYYKNVTDAVVLSPHSIKFEFDGPPNRELPQIVGQVTVFSKAYWEDLDFEKTTLDPPVSSGPYKISSFEAGRYVVLERDKDYWGEHLPVNVGSNNFDFLRYDYYLDAEVAVEAFKSGEYDVRLENSSLKWATSYDFPA
ncbi:MAG: ABC transporter substrate-binding protein, partial [Gammaproteobacteria bacterium]|nr:ABC transporter substrate-binding protein [Gammaproteobacteria bacterium]